MEAFNMLRYCTDVSLSWTSLTRMGRRLIVSHSDGLLIESRSRGFFFFVLTWVKRILNSWCEGNEYLLINSPCAFFFNWAQRHEGALGSGDIARRILDLGTRCATRLLYPQGKSPWFTLDRRLGGPQSRSGRGDEKIPRSRRDSNPRTPTTLWRRIGGV
jgi:hypothetical protein